MVVQTTSISKNENESEDSLPLTSPNDRLDIALEGDKYDVPFLVGIVEDYLKNKNTSLNTFQKNNKINEKFDDDLERDPETGELFYLEQIPFLELFFDRIYQRPDLFNPGNIIRSLNDRSGYIKQAEKPFVIFKRPDGCKDMNGVDMSGLWNPDGQHTSVMAYITSGQDVGANVTCKVFPFKKGTSLKRCRQIESYIFDTMQDVTTMTAESRFKTKFYNPEMYGTEGSTAKTIGEWMWRARLNCVDLFDKTVIRQTIDSIGAIKKANAYFAGLDKLNPALEIYRKVFNKENLTVPAHTKTISVHAVSGIAEVLDKFETENGGQADHQVLVDALVDWIHGGKENKPWKVGKAKKVDRLTKIFAPHHQIDSVAYRVGVIYNNYLRNNSNLLTFIGGGESLRIKDVQLIKLGEKMEKAVETIKLKSLKDFEQEKLLKAA